MSPLLDVPVVDAHHHFWDLPAGGDHPWLVDDRGGWWLGRAGDLPRVFGPREHRAATSGLDVVGTVHVEAERSSAEEVLETDWLEGVGERHGLPSAVVAHVTFGAPGWREVLAAQARRPRVRGVRCKPVTASSPLESRAGGPGSVQDPRWVAGLDALADAGLSWDVRVPAWHLREVADVLAERPHLTAVVEHCGLPWDRSPTGLAVWEAGMTALAELPRVSVKVSELGLPGRVWDRPGNEHVVRRVVEVFGWDRVMFGTNLPVSSLSASVPEVVATVVAALPGATRDQLSRLFARTAARVYRLPPA